MQMLVREQYAELANEVSRVVQRTLSALADSAMLNATLDAQTTSIRQLSGPLPALQDLMSQTREAWSICEAAGAMDLVAGTESDIADLEMDLAQLEPAIKSRLALIEQQQTVRNAGRATPAQLDEWSSIFKHFALNDTLDTEEFAAATGALGIIVEPDELDRLFNELSQRSGRATGVSLAIFLSYMSSRCAFTSHRLI